MSPIIEYRRGFNNNNFKLKSIPIQSKPAIGFLGCLVRRLIVEFETKTSNGWDGKFRSRHFVARTIGFCTITWYCGK